MSVLLVKEAEFIAWIVTDTAKEQTQQVRTEKTTGSRKELILKASKW